MAEALSILKQAKDPSTQTIIVKAPSPKFLQLHFKMDPPPTVQKILNWEVFNRMTDMPTLQTSIQLYSCADESVQNTIIKTYSKSFTTDPERLLKMIEVLLIQKSNPLVHRIAFSSMSQYEDEPRAMATDCNISCPPCEHDLSDIYIKDQFIRGIANNILQTDLLAKAGMPKFLDQNICHAEAFEFALWDQTAMTDTLAVATIQMPAYRRQKKTGLHI